MFHLKFQTLVALRLKGTHKYKEVNKSFKRYIYKRHFILKNENEKENKEQIKPIIRKKGTGD